VCLLRKLSGQEGPRRFPFFDQKSMTNSKHRCRAERGASLLITLIVISAVVVLLTMMARTVTVDKRVSAGYSNILRAELAAKAAAADAGDLLLELFQQHPDSATYWDPKMGETETPGTVFMFRDLPPNKAYVGTGAAAKVFARPLVSGAVTREVYPANEYLLTLPATAVDAAGRPEVLSIDINRPRRFNESNDKGWVGAPPGATTLPGKPGLEVKVPWVQMKDEEGRVVSRYVYWVEDESFKLNVNETQARLRGDAASEVDGTTGKYAPMASLRGLFDAVVSSRVQEARTQLTATDGRMLSTLQIGHAGMLPSGMTAEQFGREYRFLLTAESSALNLSRTGAKRLNLNQVVDRSLDPEVIPVVAYTKDGSGRTGPDLSVAEAPAAIGRAVGQIASAILYQAPEFGQRFYRVRPGDVLVPTTNAAGVAAKNSLDVAHTGSGMPLAEMYVNKIAANLYDYISPAVNPTVMDIERNLFLGMPVYSEEIYETMGPENGVGETNAVNWLAAVGKKRVPYFTEYMCHAKLLARNPASGEKPGANATIGYADYDIEIDHYFEFWNMTDKDIVPANGDLGPQPYLVVENQALISVDNLGKSPSALPNQNVPTGRPFEIKLDEKFLHNGSDADLVFPAGSVTVITTDPNYASTPTISGWLAGKQVFGARILYAPGTADRCDDPAVFSEAPFPSGEGSSKAVMPNVRRYRLTSFDSRDFEGNEIQFGPDMIGSTTTKLLVGNRYGLLEAHPSLVMGPQKSNMIVFKPGRQSQFRGSYLGGGLAGLYDPRSSLEAIDIRLVKASTISELHDFIIHSSMMVRNGQDGDHANQPENSSLGLLRKDPLSDGQMWGTDRIASTPGAAFAPMLIAEGPMQSIGELGRIFDPVRVAASTVTQVRQRRAGGRTLTVGQPDAVWDGTRTTALADPELKFQVSRSRGWAAWRLADIFTVRDDTVSKDPAKVEMEGLYNPNGILRDNGMVLRAMLEGVRFGTGNQSDPALQGSLFDTSKTTEILEESKRNNMFPNAVGTGGQALANYLAQRLTRSATKKFSPLWEPGELSQLDFFALKFGSSSYPFIDASVKNDALNDQGREEIFRRLADMVTPKGNTFSIYVVGQSLNRLGHPVATKAQRVTVRLRPVFTPELSDDFDPQDEEAVKTRFRSPDAYTLETINVEDA
jgi:hypothetical protein